MKACVVFTGTKICQRHTKLVNFNYYSFLSEKDPIVSTQIIK